MMKVLTGDEEIRLIVPKDVRNLDNRLNLLMYSTQDGRDKLLGVKKRGRKPKASGPSS